MDIKVIKQNRFDGGRAIDSHSVAANQFAESINFDIYSKPHALTPVRNWQADQTYNGDATGIKTSDLAVFGQRGSSLWAIGKKNDGTGRKIYKKTLSASTWSEETGPDGAVAEISTGSGGYPGFIINHNNDSGERLIWFTTVSGGLVYLGLADYSGSDPVDFDNTVLTTSDSATVPQAILGADGNVYVLTENKIVKCGKDGTVTDEFFTVNPTYTFTSGCRYGNYLALTIRTATPCISKLLLCDYANAQASEVVELGSGNAYIVENLDGQLIIIMDNQISTKYVNFGIGEGSMQIKAWNGGLQTITEVPAFGTLSDPIPQYKYLKDNILYWYAKIPQSDGTYLEGLWTFGRRTLNSPYALSLNREKAGTSFEGFWGFGDVLYAPNSGDGTVSRTSTTESFTNTSSIETAVYGGDGEEYQALGASVSFDKLTSGQTVTLAYRKDGETSWTTVDPAPAVAEGDLRAIFPLSFNFFECQLRIQTTGGATITGYTFKPERLLTQTT